MFVGTFPGRPDSVRRVRRAVAGYLREHPAVVEDAVLIVSELATNAVLHSASGGRSFTVRAELHPGYVWVEVEDLGGQWNPKPPDGRVHGLGLVESLAGSPDNWDAEETGEGTRIVWARLELAR